ncbi:uncharacterized protein [Eucyclogobius newberryi]|uniref:uncharacterized protein n=1 Tax=Eucyclogobius newberryi TaxID=166745 RepID=UPI003B5A5082
MKTLALLSVVLSVALGLPVEQKEAQAPLPAADQRPLVGDLLPVMGHVVVENPAPQPKLSKELQLSDPQLDKKEQMERPEVQMTEFVEDPQVKTDSIGDNNEIATEKKDELVEEVNLESEFTELEDNRGLWWNLEPMAETIETVEQDKDSEPNEAKYDFEQPIMELEPLINEEDLQRDELLHTDNGVYEEPAMFLEPDGNGDQFMNEQNAPLAVAMEEEGPMFDALGGLSSSDELFMRLESEEQADMLPSVEQVVHGRRSCSGVALQGKCFQFFTNPKKAAEAEIFCQESSPGGHLASITSLNVHNEMMALMRRNGGTRRTWVGGIRFLDTDRFVWLDGSHWGYADWLWGEPNNTSNLEECVEVLASGKFNDFTCWEPQAFICSYPYL